MQLSRVRVEHVDVLVEEELNKLGRLQELPLTAEDAGSLLRHVHHTAAGQREDHHKRVLQKEKSHTGKRVSRVTDMQKQLTR